MQAAAASFLDLPLDAVPDFGQQGGWEAMGEFFKDYGYTLIECDPEAIPRGYYFAVGVSTQLHPHIVIHSLGKLFHDPNPRGRGLIMRWRVLWPRPG